MSQSKKSPITKTRRGRGVRSLGSSLPNGSAPLPGQAIVQENGVDERTTSRTSPRRTLRAGDVIRVSRGPYWQARGQMVEEFLSVRKEIPERE